MSDMLITAWSSNNRKSNTWRKRQTWRNIWSELRRIKT